MIISRVFLKTTYKPPQYIGAVIVAGGIIAVLYPSLSGGGSGSGSGSGGGGSGQQTAIYAFVMILSCVPMCLSRCASHQGSHA